VVVAVGLLGDQLAQENDATAAGTVAVVNFAWPVAALAEVRRRLSLSGIRRILVIPRSPRSASVATPISTAAPRPGLDRLCEGMADSLDGTGVTLQLLRPGRLRTRMTKARRPSLHDRSRRSRRLRDEGLETNDRVIWSPPILRYAFAMLRHLPKPIWRKVAER